MTNTINPSGLMLRRAEISAITAQVDADWQFDPERMRALVDETVDLTIALDEAFDRNGPQKEDDNGS